jgi:hypothetical protein
MNGKGSIEEGICHSPSLFAINITHNYQNSADDNRQGIISHKRRNEIRCN